MSRIVKILAGLVLIVLSFVIFSGSMAKPVDDGEQASCAAGVLLTKGKMIYRDFAFVAQMPYHPFICAAIFKALNTTHYLLAGRLLTVVCDVLVLIAIVGIYRCVFASYPVTGWLLGMAMAVLYVFNPLVNRFNGLALNQDLVIVCVLLSFWSFISIDFKQKSRYLRIAVMGALLTVATCMRLTATFIQLLFFIMLLIQPAESRKQRFGTILPFLIAPAIVLTLPIWTIVQAPRAFLINVFEMPMLEMRLMYMLLLKTGWLLYEKFARFALCVTLPGGVLPVVVAICIVAIIVRSRRKLEISNITNAVVSIVVPVIFLVFILCYPITSYKNLAILVPFILISFVYPLLYLRRLADRTDSGRDFKIASIVVTACAFAAVGAWAIEIDLHGASWSVALPRLPKLFRPQDWVPMQLHKISQDIAEKTEEPKLVVTLAPLYALEGGCNIYTELSAGWSGCKIASAMPTAKRDITHTLNAETFKNMLGATPPSAIVIEKLSKSSIGLVLLRIAKTQWPGQDYDKAIWERKEYPFVVAYFRR